MAYYIGLMSGTSMDGVDAVLCDITHQHCKTLAQASVNYPDALLLALHSLCTAREADVTHLAQLDREVALVFANAVSSLLLTAGVAASDICAIGSHGQTVRHHPDHSPGITMQLGDINTLSVETGMTTIGDFRRKDVALGGQGAPLAPAFHQFQFQSQDTLRVVANIGGIANITVLPPASSSDRVIGFDTGPGNTLMDAWCRQHKGTAYDKGGLWAGSGTPDPELLSDLLDDDYFARPHPKSTGREYFNEDWLSAKLNRREHSLSATDIQATLLVLTSETLARAVASCVPESTPAELILCGGGAFNNTLIASLTSTLANKRPQMQVITSDTLGLHPQWVEGAAFAWLAWAHQHNVPGNLPEVTGALRPAVLGVQCPA